MTVALVSSCTSTIEGKASGVSLESGPLVEVFDQVAEPPIETCVDTVRGGSGPLGPPPTVSCAEPHGGEIARVLPVSGALDGPYPTDEDLNSDAWSERLYGGAGCGLELANQYLGGRERDNLLVETSPYLPKRAAWEAGARWIACVVTYLVGFFEDVNAPGRMAGAMQGPDADAYRECWFGPQIVYDVVNCSQPHDAEPTGDFANADIGTAYPDDPLDREPLIAECTDRVANYLDGEIPEGYVAGIYLPSEEDWPLFLFAECVILDSAGSRRTGSAVDA